MGQIYISAETKKRLLESAASKSDKLLLEKFDPNRESKVKNAPRQPMPRIEPENKKVSTVRKISDEEWEKIKANADRQGYKVEIERRLKEKRKRDALVAKYGVSSPSKKRARKHRSSGSQKAIQIKPRKDAARGKNSSKPLNSTSNKDYYDFAGEYQSRMIEVGHGRKKSQEWQGVHLSGTGGSIRHMKKLMRDDPNTFDRQAMK